VFAPINATIPIKKEGRFARAVAVKTSLDDKIQLDDLSNLQFRKRHSIITTPISIKQIKIKKKT